MSKAVLISIRPEWCEKIASGQKTIEVRKTRPKIETPFKCYIYCTANDIHRALVVGGGTAKQIVCFNYKTAIPVGGTIGNGKVIGEFVCDNVGLYKYGGAFSEKRMCFSLRVCSGLSIDELKKYAYGKDVYGWHISDLVIYDKPKELSEFAKPCYFNYDCGLCKAWDPLAQDCMKKHIKAPQSWCYVEEL